MGSHVPKEIAWQENGEGCWVCTSHRPNDKGYPYVRRDGFKSIAIYRLMYRRQHGDPPKGMVVRHDCDNRMCINPNHLRLGTYRDNNEDRKRNGTWQTGENCPRHTLTDDEVLSIRRLYQKGDGAILARIYGVVPSTIRMIANKQRRRFLTGAWDEESNSKVADELGIVLREES